MSTVSGVLNHSVFQVERYGDALVVAPQGDAIGFSPNRIQVELRAIEKLLDQRDVRHLIIDLHRTDYFGSDMIGHISRLGIKARQTGGRMALCDVSADMQDIFDVMHFNQIWETFATRRQALRAIASVPILERLMPLRKYVIGAIAVAAIVVAAIYYPWPTRNKRCFDLMVSYSAQWQKIQKSDKDSTNRTLFRKRVQKRLKPMMEELAIDSANGNEAATYLHAAGTQGLLPMLATGSIDRHEHEDVFIDNMSEAAKYIQGATPPTLEIFGRPPSFSRTAQQNGKNRSAQRLPAEETR